VRRVSRLTLGDVLRVATSSLRARRLRAVLSALGVAIGIATIVAVMSIPASSQAELLDQLGRMGNLLTVQSGQSLDGAAAPLPLPALSMIRRIPPVVSATAVGVIPNTSVRRSAAIPAVETGGIAVVASDIGLLTTLGGAVQHGSFLNAANARYPTVVLGRGAAQTLGIPDVAESPQVFIGARYFTVIGILDAMPFSPEIDDAALVGFPAAATYLQFDGSATEVYVRAQVDQVLGVQAVLAASANPESPEAVRVSRPSDAIAARAAAKGNLNGLLLGLGLVALLVGGIGVANVMIVGVIERRNEIGLRRALGATRAQIAGQFVAESLVLSAIGGLLGVALGVIGTVLYAHATAIPVVIPFAAAAAALGSALAVGAVAGVYPAARAARLAPAEALRAA